MPSVILQKVNLMWRVLVAKMVDRNANQSRLREMQAWWTGPDSIGLLRWVGLARLIQQKFMVVAGFEPATYGRKATGQTTWTNMFFWFKWPPILFIGVICSSPIFFLPRSHTATPTYHHQLKHHIHQKLHQRHNIYSTFKKKKKEERQRKKQELLTNKRDECQTWYEI